MQADKDDKFILITHIYETSQDGWNYWSENTNQLKYFQLLQQFKNQIVVQITGHDHQADFRTHSASLVWDKDKSCLQQTGEQGWFLGKMISPAITPGSNTQPGYTTIDYTDGLLTNVQMTFLQLDQA